MTMVLVAGFALAAAAEKPERLEIRHSMLGYRSTLVFYSFKTQPVILVLNIGNQDESFPVTGKVHLFDKATSEAGLKKWINNKHSDALFVDAAQPSSTKTLADGFCTVTAKKQTGTSTNPGPHKAAFKDFELSLSIKAQDLGDGYTLPAFTDTARVHVQSK
ncbi:MAG: hypothetical protein ACI8W8_004569 [Rhodothermales bacterium]|jgi:hypothetical protein